MSKAKKHKAFTVGAVALQRVSEKGSGDVYACPLCGLLLPRTALDDGRLTLEHVPPESVGGRKLVLTCKLCNNRAGHGVDAHADREEKLKAFGKALRGEGSIEGQRARVEWRGRASMPM